MSKSAIGASTWAELSEAQRIEAVSTGRATLREMVEGLLDGPSQLREICRTFLASANVCLEPLPVANKIDHNEDVGTPCLGDELDEEQTSAQVVAGTTGAVLESARKRRPGLPEGYVPRLQKL